MLSGDGIFQRVNIGASRIEPTFNTLIVSAKGPSNSEDSDDAESFPDAPVYGMLGIIGRPYPKTDSGQAQGLLVRDGSFGALLGMRDNRTNEVYGNLLPGDTCVYSTGPKHNARLILKEETNSVVALGKDSDGNDMMVSLDGENDALSLQAFGGIIQIDKTGIVIGFKGNQLVINESGITVGGKSVILGAGTPTGGAAMGVPQAVSPGGSTSLPFKCSGSVYITT